MRIAALLLACCCCIARAEVNVQYIANAGVLVSGDESKILFDPLFDNDYGQYYLPPGEVRAAILSGLAPFDNVNAVFISHAHSDHFVSSDILVLLRQQPQLRLYGSAQVAAALRESAEGGYAEVFDRVTSISLAHGDSPVSITQGELKIDAARIPHSGWPDRMSNVENIAFRVSLHDGTTVLHLGDADVSDTHYAPDADYWHESRPDVAFPPYWYFLSSTGRRIINDRLRPALAIGVHVPKSVPVRPASRQEGLRDVTLFTRPGQARVLQPR